MKFKDALRKIGRKFENPGNRGSLESSYGEKSVHGVSTEPGPGANSAAHAEMGVGR